jgi:hypothetical protein
MPVRRSTKPRATARRRIVLTCSPCAGPSPLVGGYYPLEDCRATNVAPMRWPRNHLTATNCMKTPVTDRGWRTVESSAQPAVQPSLTGAVHRDHRSNPFSAILVQR